jgi:hypothetical protein
MIFKIFSSKNFAKKMAFLTRNKAKLCKILIITLVFEKNANFFADNCPKSQKIVIIASTPGELSEFRSYLHRLNPASRLEGVWDSVERLINQNTIFCRKGVVNKHHNI